MRTNLLYIIWFQIFWHAFSINNIDIDLAVGLPLSQGFQIAGSIAGVTLAYSARKVGDVNGDGYSDVIVGESGLSSGKGAAFIIYGQPEGTATNIDLNSFPLSQGFSIFGGVSGTYFGIAVNGGGDVNNDGYNDFIVGADQGNGVTGMAYVFYGGTTSNIYLSNGFTLSQGFTIIGVTSGDRLGHSVAFAGDVNKDGYADIIVGAYAMGSSRGTAYVIYGQSTNLASNIDVTNTLTSSQGFKITGSASGDKLGNFLNSAGDVNQDGYDDIIIGADGFSLTGRSGAGAVYVIYGKPTNQASNIDLSATLPLSKGFQIIGSVASSRLGISMSSAGDVNQDGYDDIIVGASGFSMTGRINAGAAYIIYGKPTSMAATIDLSVPLSLSQGFQVIGDVASANLGSSVSSAGDFDKDGYDDVLIGAAHQSHTGRGAAYIIYGRPENLAINIDLSTPLRPSQGFKVTGVTSADNFGNSAGSAGDMNKDGYNDIIIGAPLASPLTRSSAGAAYVIYSQVPPCNTPHCIQCLASRCLACETDFLLYSGDSKCYINGNCPAGTSSNSTHCVDPAMETLAVAQGLASQAAGLATSAVTAVSFGNPEGMMFAALSGTLMYMKYINLSFPPKLQYILNQPDFSLISIEDISSPPDQIQDKMPSYVLPDNFEKNGLDSSFLINFWSSLTNLLMIVTAIIILFLASYLTKNCRFVNTKINKVQESLHWNYLLGTFAGCYGPTAFYSSFQFRTVQFESGLETFSFFICLFTNILLFAILVKTILITTKLMQEKNTTKLKKLKEHLKAYQILFESFKSDSFMHQSYFLFSCIRFYVFYLILAYLYAYPLFQAILISLQGLLFLSYLLLYRPFTSKLDLVGSIIFEVILQVEHACGIGFAIINQSGIETTTHRAVVLGNIVIVSISVFIGVQCLYSFIQIVGLAINLFKFIKRRLSPSNAHAPKSGQKYKTSLKKNNRADLEMINEDDSVTMASPFERKKVISPPQPAVLPRNHAQTFNRLNRVKYNRDEKSDNPHKFTVKKRIKEIDAESMTNSVNPNTRPAMKKNFIRDEINS